MQVSPCCVGQSLQSRMVNVSLCQFFVLAMQRTRIVLKNPVDVHIHTFSLEQCETAVYNASSKSGGYTTSCVILYCVGNHTWPLGNGWLFRLKSVA